MNNIILKPGRTVIYKTGSLRVLYESLFGKIISKIISIMSALAIIYLVVEIINQSLISDQFLGLALFILAAGLFFWSFNLFYHDFLLYPISTPLGQVQEAIDQGQTVNLWHYLSASLSHDLLKNGQKIEQTDSRKLAITLIDSLEIKYLLLRLAVPADELKQYLEGGDAYDGRVEEIALRALKIAVLENHQQISSADLFLALTIYDPILKKYFFQRKIENADIANVIYWLTEREKQIKKQRLVFDPDNLVLSGGIGRDWAFGYTLTLERFSIDLSETARSGGFANLKIEAKEREVSLIEEALTRAESHNVLLVGDPGIGKKTTVYGLADKIYRGESTNVLKNRRLLELDLEGLISDAGNPNEIIGRIQGVFNEAAYAGNIIIFIDNLANLITNEGQVGQVNASEVLKSYLENRNIFIVGTADERQYRQQFSPNKGLMAHFVKVELHEPSFDETIRIVFDNIPEIEYRNSILVSYEAIKEAIKLTDRYQQNLSQPQKSITLIDQAATKKKGQGGGILLPADVDQVIREQIKVPVGDLEKREKEILLNLEAVMRRRIIGQVEAVTSLADALRRARAGVTQSKKPIGSFLFMGPTGVGKTETAKTLAEIYFGSEETMLRFDMSEYQQKSDLYRLIGDSESKNGQGNLTSAVLNQPFSLLLFDEIEKAHPDILNLFLQVLDEGNLTDAFGQKCSFSNTIIIMTSNAGSEFIRQTVGDNFDNYQNQDKYASNKKSYNYDQIQKGLIDFIQKNNLFRPEFINRFTGVIVFKPLTLPEIGQVAELMINKLSKRLKEEKGVTIIVTPEVVNRLAEIGYDPQMGARPMERAIAEHLENLIAKKLLSNEIKRGDQLSIGVNDLGG